MRSKINRNLAAGRRHSRNFILAALLILSGMGLWPAVDAAARSEPSTPAVVDSGLIPNAASLLPLSTVSLNVPASVRIGETFTFTATFDNTDADEVGYGPFIDLVFPVTGADGAGAGADDGIDFVSATYLGASVISVQNTFGPANTGGCTGGLGPVNHPYAVAFPTGAPLLVCGTPGDKLVTLLLPFGSFAPDQPPAVVTVTATLSNLADVNTALTIRARGGYQFGATPLNDWCCTEGSIVSHPGDSPAWPGSPTTPTILSLTKTYNGPEDETATGPNYPRQYTLTVDIAAGQTVDNLTVTDNLPGNMQFVGVAGSTPAATCTTTPNPLTTPGGALTCNFGNVTGGAGTSDATVTFDFYIPLNDSGSLPVIDAASGDDVTSLNASSAGGNWTPIDGRDPLTPVSAGGVCPEGCHTLTDKSIAIQKSVANVADIGAAGYSPGDTLEYTLTFQISDFFSFQNVVVTDVISDGQRVDLGFAPRLQVNGNSFTLASAAMNAANYTIDNSQIGNSGPNPPPDGTDGSQTIIFRVSDEIITRGQSGKLIGGCVPVAGTGGPPPDCGAYSDSATTATIVFRAVIQDNFTDTYPSGDPSVDHGDLLTNDVTVTGDLLSVADNASVTGQSEADGSQTSLNLAFGVLAKSVYAVNGSVCEPCTTEISINGVSPGDTLTFRLRYTQPSSDFEPTTLTDYLPLPIFFADDPNADGAAGPAWTQDASSAPPPPASAQWKYGPADTFHLRPGASAPTVTADATNNTVAFSYPQYDDPTNTTSEIDLLFTVTLSDEPFADGMFLTNQANSIEGTTNAGNQALNSILQIKINEPVLIPTKSAVSTDSTATGISFSPAIGAPIVFDAPGVVDGTPDWSGGVINSNYLAANPINANLSGIDGGDRVKFAIVIENRGHGVDGAFDIAIKDAMPPQLAIPASGLNLEAFLGDGTALAFDPLGAACTGVWPGDPCGPDGLADTPDDLFGNGIQLIDPGVPPTGACQAHHDTSGQNVIIITYDLQLSGNGVTTSPITNTTTLLSYSSSEGGTNFIPSGVTDTASLTPAAPSLTKSLKATSEAHTSDVSNPPRVTIGEIVRYRLTVLLPEGNFTNFQIDDNLPGGMTYLDDGTARVAFISNGAGISSAAVGTLPVPAIPPACVVSGNETTPIPDPLPCALADGNVGSDISITTDPDAYANSTDPQFKLGTLTNADSDADREVIVIEFNALVNNTAAGSNDAGDNRDNTFQLNVSGTGYGSVSAAQRVRISEPSITDVNKVVNPSSADAGNTVTYTVTFSNASGVNNTTAFDVVLTDTLSPKMSLNLASITASFLPAACSSVTANTSSGNNINLVFGTLPTGCQVTVTYQADLLSSVVPGEALTNTANVTYTSLPGTNGTVGNPTGSNTPGTSGSDTGERDGSGAPVHNDYFDSDGAQVDVTQTQPLKSIVATSAAHTSEAGDGSAGNERALAIGEEVTYAVLLTFGEGTTASDSLVDDLPAGLEIVAGTPEVITTAAASGGLLAADFNGTIGTQNITVIPGDGGSVAFDFTNVAVAGDNDLTNNAILMRFRARLTNTAVNVAGTIVSNQAANQVNGGPLVLSNAVGVEVVEPFLNITKSADDSSWVYGQTVTFTLGVAHDAASAADAFEIVVTDVIPAGLTYVAGSITAPAGWSADASAAPTLTWTCAAVNGCSLPVGGSASLTYQAAVDSPPDPDALTISDTAVNTATAQWTSLPGDNSPGNPSGERDGSGGVNYYNDSASHTGGLEKYALGNRVWFDTNNNSLMDAGEVGVDGVVVNLYSASDLSTIIATDTTSGGGYYLFDQLLTGDYVVVIPASNFASGAVLEGYWSSGTTRSDDGSLAELTAPDADLDSSDVDDNGMRQNSGPFSGGVVALTVSIGPGGVEPVGETDLEAGAGQGQPDAQANMTVDFGFYTIRLGDLVWNDVDNSGLADAGDFAIANVDVQLWSADLSLLLATDTTDGSGVYTFTGLPQGNYVVRIPAAEFNPGGTLRDYFSSTGSAVAPFPYEPGADAEANTTDSDDNGTETGGTLGLGGYIQSSVFALTPAAEQSFDNNTGSTTEFRVDFGVINSPRANLSVTKDDGVSYYVPGGTLTYTVVVTNHGPSDANGMTVQDARPPQISSWTWTCAAGTPAAYNCTDDASNPSTFTDSLDLPQGASVTYEVTAQVDPSASGDLTNTVSVAPPAGTMETDASDNDASDVDEPASLQITKDDGVFIVSPAAVLTYTLLVENTGAIDLTDLTVTDTLPSDVTFQSAVPAPATNAGGVLTWTGLSLASGDTMTITVTVQVNNVPAGTSITNNAAVTDAGTGASDSDDDTDTVSLNSNFAKTLVLSSEAHTTDPNAAIGEILTYELVLIVPSGTMDNVLVVDTPQAGLAFVDLVSVVVSNPDTDGAGAGDTGISSSGMTFDGTGLCTNCDDGTTSGTSNPLIENSGGRVTFDFGSITNSAAGDETVTIRYNLIVLDAAVNQDGATLTNSAAWSWDGGNLQAFAAPVEVVEPDMTIDKNAQPPVAPLGATINFEIAIAHTAQSSADAFDVVVTDVLPSGLAYIPGTEVFTGLAPTSFTYNPATATLTIVWDVLPLGQSAAISFDAAFVGPPPTVNTSSVEWTSLPIDPAPGGGPVQLSAYNTRSTERWYDPSDATGLNNYAVQDSLTITVPGRLPSTGFAPNTITHLPEMPEGFSYSQTGLWLEIPRLGVKMDIVGVPFGSNDWNITWLGNHGGWLEGSAYPTHAGNSAITAHSYLSNGLPGPFANLDKLRFGDQIIVHLAGQKYIFEVRENLSVKPTSVSVLKHEKRPWLTLITCKTYNEEIGEYVYRVVVRAVLVSIESE